MKILITSGGCKVPIDDVRHIGNFSSGRYGAEIAYEFWGKGGHDIVLYHEKGSKTGFEHQHININDTSIKFIEYKDYWDYLDVKPIIKAWQPDIIISAAAISDYIVDKTEGKISSNQDELVIRLKKGEKVLASFRELAPNALIVGFKLLVSPTTDERLAAVKKVLQYADLVVFNDLTELRKGNATRLLVDQWQCSWPVVSVNALVKEIMIWREHKTKQDDVSFNRLLKCPSCKLELNLSKLREWVGCDACDDGKDWIESSPTHETFKGEPSWKDRMDYDDDLR